MLKEEFKLIKETKKDLRKFGLTVGIVLLFIAALLFNFEKTSWIYFGAAGLYLLLNGFFFPRTLKPFNKLWMGLAIVLGFVMSRVILTILFYIILTPVSFIAKIFGKKFMPLKFDKSANTYWEKRSVIQKKQIDYERQF
jgi:hypothetical protein